MYVNQNIKPITTKINSKGNIEISGCDIVDLANKYKTPLYVVDRVTLETMALDYKKAFSKYEKANILFASKALMTGAIAQIFNKLGFGFDVVSMGEIYTLINAGIKLNKSSFNGNNKSKEEIELALDNEIDHFSVDNFYVIPFITVVRPFLQIEFQGRNTLTLFVVFTFCPKQRFIGNKLSCAGFKMDFIR